MTLFGVIGAIIIGAIIGVLARLILPGRQNISVLVTILLGIVSALIGGFLASLIGVRGSSILTFVIELVVALIVVGLVAGTAGRRR